MPGQQGSETNIDKDINRCRIKLQGYSSDDPKRPAMLLLLAFHLSSKYGQHKRIEDLNEAIDHGRVALSLCPLEHQNRSMYMDNLTADLFSRYKQLGNIADLDEAIVCNKGVLLLYPTGHSNRAISLTYLAGLLSSRYQLRGDTADLDEAIAHTTGALLLRPLGHSDRWASLNDLAVLFCSRYERLGEIDDLNKAIDHSRQAFSLCPTEHPCSPGCLNNLAAHLCSRYERLGGIGDLDEAIVHGRAALSLRKEGHPNRSTPLINLAVYLSSRYEQRGAISDLDEAIVHGREALSLLPSQHPNRSATLGNLASRLCSRYKQLQGIDDLNEAIVCNEGALLLCQPGHPGRSISLSNLAGVLFFRSKECREIADLDKAILHAQEALSLCPPGNPRRSISLSNLAVYLSSRYARLKVIGDLDKAIVHDRDALSLCPLGHPDRSTSLNNLANHLFSRYKQTGVMNDLNEAITLCQDALTLRPRGNPDRSASLEDLAGYCYVRFKQLGQEEDKQRIFSLYTELEHVSGTVFSSDLPAAKAWANRAEEFHHSTVALAYETALRLLVEHLAALPPLPQHLTVLKSLSSTLAVDAFSACLRNQHFTKAVELLEQGRGVFWSQLTRLRSPLQDVIESGSEGKVLAAEFTRLTTLIRMTLRSPGASQHDQVCRLNVELKEVVTRIRALPRLSRFLLPLPFSDLKPAANDGPVVIVNASKYGCDALVVFADKDPVHIPLSVGKNEVQLLVSSFVSLNNFVRWGSPKKVETKFQAFLRELWDKVVSCIMKSLEITCPRGSRIWWCPTAEFSLLPLHAAAPYREGQEGVMDLYISSYTTTLAALIYARRPSPPNSTTEKKRFIAISQVDAIGYTKLPSVDTEAEDVHRHVTSLATSTWIKGENACVSRIADEIGQYAWVHFACHGIPNQDKPFESGFALRDGLFTVQRIIQCDLENPEFAYLSACQTTVGDRECPDEVIHLASAMQFAGFRSVIGTMWAVKDSAAKKVASKFYEGMATSGQLGHTRAALTLRETTRTADIPTSQKVLFIHLGA